MGEGEIEEEKKLQFNIKKKKIVNKNWVNERQNQRCNNNQIKEKKLRRNPISLL